MVNINVHRASMTDSYENSKPYIEGACLSTDNLPTPEDFSVGSYMSVIDTSAGTTTVKINTGSAWMNMLTFEG